MKKQSALVDLAALLATSLCTLSSADAGMVKIVNDSSFVLGVGVTYKDGSRENPVIINPKNSRPGLGSPVKAVTRIMVVNTTSGTDPSKAVLKDYLESAPHFLKDYIVTVDRQGAVTVQLQGNLPAVK